LPNQLGGADINHDERKRFRHGVKFDNLTGGYECVAPAGVRPATQFVQVLKQLRRKMVRKSLEVNGLGPLGSPRNDGLETSEYRR